MDQYLSSMDPQLAKRHALFVACPITGLIIYI